MNQVHRTTKTRTFKYLSEAERGKIEALYNEGLSISAIARRLSRHKSTISREIRRGTTTQIRQKKTITVYLSDCGQARYEKGRQHSKKPFKLNKASAFITWCEEKVLEEKRTFELAWGYALVHGLFTLSEMVCVKTLYNYADLGLLRVKPYHLPLKLRRKTKRDRVIKHKKKLGKSIEERPVSVNDRDEFSHWEVDLVIGKKGKDEPVILTLVERKTRYTICIRLPNKTAASVNRALKEVLNYFHVEGESASRVFKTITADNGLEFASLDELNAYFTAYYAHPYSSWERGTNEKHKGILRRFIGKGQSFKDLTQESLAHITDMMNNLPKKVLGYRKPEEVFEEELDALFPQVANMA